MDRYDRQLIEAGPGSTPIVKICGLQAASHAQAGADAGADLLGFILAPSRRRVMPEVVRRIRESLRTQGPLPKLVGVFVNEDVTTINQAVTVGGLDAVQLSGDEAPETVDDLKVPVIKVLRLPVGLSELELLRSADVWFARSRPVSMLLVDGHVHGVYGGTGVLANWTAAAVLARRYPVLLAGGLTPHNVGEVIAEVGPFGVDVSSGVEAAGVKQPELIADFIGAARSSRPKMPTEREAAARDPSRR